MNMRKVNRNATNQKPGKSDELTFQAANVKKIMQSYNEASETVNSDFGNYPRSDIVSKLFSTWEKNSGPVMNETVREEHEAFVNQWFELLDFQQVMSILHLFKSLPCLGTEEEILKQEAANNAKTKTSGVVKGELLDSSRKAMISNYIEACKLAAPLLGKLTFKPTWTQIASTEFIYQLTASFTDELLTRFPKSKDIVYCKIFYVNLNPESVFKMFKMRMTSAFVLLARHQKTAKRVPKGTKVQGTNKVYNSDCYIWENKPTLTMGMGDSDPETDERLAKCGMFPDWRFLLQAITIDTSDEEKKNICNLIMTGISIFFAQGSVDTKQFVGKPVKLVKESQDGPLPEFVQEYYKQMQFYKTSFRNLTRWFSNARNPLKSLPATTFTRDM